MEGVELYLQDGLGEQGDGRVEVERQLDGRDTVQQRKRETRVSHSLILFTPLVLAVLFVFILASIYVFLSTTLYVAAPYLILCLPLPL